MSGLLAVSSQTRGFPPNQVIPAGIVALIGTVATIRLAYAYRAGGVAWLRRAAGRFEATTGLPAWCGLPTALATTTMLTAMFGFYWDVAWHIDRGRDQGPFATPAHYLIIIGLVGIALSGLLSIVLDGDQDGRAPVRLPGGWRGSVGGALLFLCGTIALLGFPLDDIWHTLFGQDVTLWGPTHIQMVGGASISTIAVWILIEEGRRRAVPKTAGAGQRKGVAARIVAFRLRSADAVNATAVLIGMSTLQGEYDFGLPQFRETYHPILIMLAAGIALVTARIRVGRGGALLAALGFCALRGGLAVLIGPVLGRSTLHFPLYLVEALCVEAAAFLVPRSQQRQITFGLVSGALIGTFGLAAEWGWSQLWFPIPWRAVLFPQAAILAFFAALAGGVLGGAIGRALLPPKERVVRQPSPRFAMAGAWTVILVVLGLALPMGAHTGYRATVSLQQVPALRTDKPGVERAFVTMKLDPPSAADKAAWFQITAWQGGDGILGSSERGAYMVPLEKVSDGVFRSTAPVPVGGKWKTLARLATATSLDALPIGLPADPAIPVAGIAPPQGESRAFVRDKTLLQREALDGKVGLQRIGYAILLSIGAVWMLAFGVGLRRLDREGAGRLGQLGLAA